MWLKQSTASQEILLGPFLDSTDGNTVETALSIANTDIKVWKEGGTTEANKTAGGATHIASGRYYAVLDATDTDTLGKLEVNVHVAGALAVRRSFMVVPANVYDSLVLGTDVLQADTTQWLGTACATPTVAGVPEVDTTHLGGDAQSATDLKDFADAGYDPATNKVQGVVLTDTAGSITSLAKLEAQMASWITGTAQAGAAGTITLAAGASAVTDFHKGSWLFITSGTGVGQGRKVTAYNGTTKVATVSPDWATTPGATSVYYLVPEGLQIVDSSNPIAADVRQWIGTAVATPTTAGVPEVDVTYIGGDAQSATDLKDFADDGYDPATNKVQGVVLVDTATTLTGHTAQTGDSFARIGAAGAGLTGVPWNASWDAEVQSEVQDAIEVNHLDHLLAADYDPASKPGVATALLNELVENDAGVSRFTVNSLENAPSGSGASASAIADEVQTRTIAAVTLVTTTTNLTNLPAAAALEATSQAIKADTAATLLDTGTDGVVVATASKTGYALSSAGVEAVWAYVVEGSMTAVQAVRGMFAALVNKISGGGTTTVVFRDQADTKARITATVDTDGNRSAVTTDLT